MVRDLCNQYDECLYECHKEYRQKLTELLNIPISDFKFSGLYNLKSELKLKYYKPFIEKLELYNIPFSIADNDLRSISKSKCCCGDVLIKKSTDFNTTALLKKYGSDYSLQNVYEEIGCYGDCSCKSLKQLPFKTASFCLHKINPFNKDYRGPESKNAASPLKQRICGTAEFQKFKQTHSKI